MRYDQLSKTLHEDHSNICQSPASNEEICKRSNEEAGTMAPPVLGLSSKDGTGDDRSSKSIRRERSAGDEARVSDKIGSSANTNAQVTNEMVSLAPT